MQIRIWQCSFRKYFNPCCAGSEIIHEYWIRIMNMLSESIGISLFSNVLKVCCKVYSEFAPSPFCYSNPSQYILKIPKQPFFNQEVYWRHSMARANLNKSEKDLTNTTARFQLHWILFFISLIFYRYELLNVQKVAKEDKKQLRRCLKEHELKFLEANGRPMPKDELKEHEFYSKYKMTKAKLKLVDALLSKLVKP